MSKGKLNAGMDRGQQIELGQGLRSQTSLCPLFKEFMLTSVRDVNQTYAWQTWVVQAP